MTIEKPYIKICAIVFLYAAAVINAVNTTEKTDDKIAFSLIVMTIVLIWCIIEKTVKPLKNKRHKAGESDK